MLHDVGMVKVYLSKIAKNVVIVDRVVNVTEYTPTTLFLEVNFHQLVFPCNLCNYNMHYCQCLVATVPSFHPMQVI